VTTPDEIPERLEAEHPDASPEELTGPLLVELLGRFELMDALRELG